MTVHLKRPDEELEEAIYFRFRSFVTQELRIRLSDRNHIYMDAEQLELEILFDLIRWAQGQHIQEVEPNTNLISTVCR